MDLRDLWRGGLSLRRLSVLVQFLPAGSAVWAVTQDLPHGWTLTDLLVADVFHATAGEPHPYRPDISKTRKAKKAQQILDALLEQQKRLGTNKQEQT